MASQKESNLSGVPIGPLNTSVNSTGGWRPDWQCSVPTVDPFLEAYRFAINVVFLGTVSTVGIVGNLITCVVLKTDKSAACKGSSSSTSLILLCLAVFDTLFALSCVFAQLLPTAFHMLQVDHQVSNFEARMFPFAFYFGSAARMMRNWTIVLVSIERWIAIFKPLHAQDICTVKKAKVAVALIVLVAASYNVPRFIETTPIAIDCGNYTRLVYTRSPLRANWAYQYVYMITLYMIFVIAGPMLILTVLNFLLMRAIRQVAAEREHLIGSSRVYNMDARKSVSIREEKSLQTTQSFSIRSLSRSSTTKQNNNNNNNTRRVSENSVNYYRRPAVKYKSKAEITRMCVGIIMLYIICELPALVYQVLFYIKVPRTITVYIQPISNGLVALNSALNFFVYVFLGKRFRRRVSDLLACKCKKNDTRRLSELALKCTVATDRTLSVRASNRHVAFDQSTTVRLAS